MCNRNRNNRNDTEQDLPEFRKPTDMIAHCGRSLRDRYDALRPYSDVKNWR